MAITGFKTIGKPKFNISFKLKITVKNPSFARLLMRSFLKKISNKISTQIVVPHPPITT